MAGIRLDVQPAQVAIAWLLSKPGVAEPIIGATKIEHLEAAIAAVDLKLGDEAISQLEAPYQPHAVRIGLKPFILGGSSFGGMLACEMARSLNLENLTSRRGRAHF